MLTASTENFNGLISEKEAAKRLGVCPRTIINWRTRGIVPFVRLGRSIRYRTESLHALIERSEIGGAH